MENNPLYSCETVPHMAWGVENGCLDRITNSYVFKRTLGAGVTGITVNVARGNHNLAIKIVRKKQDAVDEIQTQCKINELRKQSPVFGETYGWTMCDEIPETWLSYMRGKFGFAIDLENAANKKKGNFVFIAMEMNSNGFDDIVYSEEDLICIFFLLIHGLAVARRRYPGFRHRDIHSGNIMIQLVPLMGLTWQEAPVVDVVVGEQHRVEITNLQRIPRIIDFGFTRFEKNLPPPPGEEDWNPNDESSTSAFGDVRNDLVNIGDIIVDTYARMRLDDTNLREFRQSPLFTDAKYTTDYPPLEKLLLHHDYFKIPNIRWI